MTLFGFIRRILSHTFNLQSEHDELEKKFFEERAALEAKYEKFYEPLYTKVCRDYFLGC